MDAATTIPAPFPGAVLAVFALVARIPFAWAVPLWTLAACVAVGWAVVLAARLTATPLSSAAIVLAFPAAVVPLPLGQVTPFVLLAICGCAALLARNRPELAALVALGTAFDPQVALAVGLGLFVCVPRTRLVLVAGCAGLIALGLAVSGPALEWEYLRFVLPAHALANVPEFSQLSVAHLAFIAGMSARAALMLGNVWYGASLVGGVLVALRVRERWGPASIAFVPVAFAVFGGAHTHLQQLAFAIPAFLLACSAATGKRRALLVGATFVAAVPWLIVTPFPVLYLAVVVLAVAFAQTMHVPSIALTLAVGSAAALGVLCVAVVHPHAPGVVFAPPATGGNPLAQVSWAASIRASSVPPQVWAVLAKIPTLLAYLVMLSVLVRAAVPPVRRQRGALVR